MLENEVRAFEENFSSTPQSCVTMERWQTLRSAVLSQPAYNSSSPKLLSVGNCEGCKRWRKGKRWGVNCTVCVRNEERIVDNYAQ